MVQYACDALVKALREQRGLTQSQLAEGICTRDTISRIERGERLPDWFTFHAIMTKLGEDSSRYYKTIATQDEKRAWELRLKAGHNTLTKRYEENKALIEEMEQDDSFKKGVNLQHLLREKGANVLGLSGDYQAAYEYLLASIRATRPDFVEEDIETYFLTPDEILTINSIAIAHDFLYGIEKATETFLRLKKNLDRNYLNKDTTMKYATSIWTNIARNLRRLGRYEECLAICEEGISFCERMHESYFYPKFLMSKSHTLFLMGKHEEAMPVFEQACHLYKGLNRIGELESFKKQIQEDFGVTVNI